MPSTMAELAARKPKRFRVSARRRLKLKELVLYILQQCPEGLTMEQITGILFKLDMEAYRQTGKPMTGLTYYKTATGVEA